MSVGGFDEKQAVFMFNLQYRKMPGEWFEA